MGEELKTTSGAGYRCAYCGRWLDLRYYFCLNCAAVHREPDARIYGDPLPFVPSAHTRVAEEGRRSLDLFCVLAVGLVVISGLGEVLRREDAFLAIAVQEIFIAAVVTSYAFAQRAEIAPFFRRIRVNWVLAASLPILAALLALNKTYHDFLITVLGREAEDTVLSRLIEELSWPVLIATICVLPGFFEEIAFRGVVQERLSRAVGMPLGIAVTSLLFVALHFSLLSAPYLFLLSVFLCWVRVRTDSLYPPMVLHFLHNLGVLVVLEGGERMMAMSSAPARSRRHLLPLSLGVLVLAGGVLLDPGPEGLSLAGVPLPSACWLRSTPLGGCPGCGITRSVAAICHLRPRESLAFHPGGVLVAAIVLLDVPYRLAALRGRRLPAWTAGVPRAARWLWIGVLAAGIIRWVVTLGSHARGLHGS